MSLLFLLDGVAGGITACELKHSKIKIISGHVYKLSFKIRSTLAQQLNVRVENSGGGTTSLNQNKVITANAWQTVKFEFTASASDDNSVLRVILQASVQEVWFDKFRLIDLTMHRREYRIMRIQGSVLPGSFIQILTLREKTANETA